MSELFGSIPAWASGSIGLLIGALLGHWLAIGRDKRKAREDAFDKARRSLLSLSGPAALSAGDVDAIMFHARKGRGRKLRAALDRCEKAAAGYYCTEDGWGTPMPSAESRAAMAAARRALVHELRRP